MDENLKNQVIEILEEEQNELDGCLDNPSDVIAPSTLDLTSVTQNSDGTWTKEVTTETSNLVDGSIDQANRSGIIKKAETLQEFCRVVDNKILSFNAEIDAKKQQIVNLSLEAANGNCWPGIAHSLAPFTGITSFYGSTVVFKGEVERIKIYPKMAGPDKDYGAENVFEPDTIYNMSSAYAGYGYKNLPENTYYQNKDGSLTGLGTDGSGANIGNARFDISTTPADHNARLISAIPYRFYEGAGVSPDATDTSVTPTRCVSIANSITAIYQEIINIRGERDSLRSDLNTVKENKLEKELASWGMYRIENRVGNRKTKNSSAIAAVKSFDSATTVNIDSLVLHLDAGDSDSYSGIGTSWNDLSGNGNNVTLFPTGSPATYEYSDGGFLTFNGTDEYAETVTKATDIIGTGDWTIETWFKINGAPSDTQYSNVIVDTNPSGSTANMLNVTFGTSGDFAGITTNAFAYSSRPSGSYTHLVGSEIRNDLWYHGVVVRNGTTNTKLYLNGNLVNTYTGNLPTDSAGVVRIARWTDETVFSNISVSVVKIYQTAHDDNQVREKFNASRSRYVLVG